MKIALVRCPCINLPYPPPIGLAYIASFLKSAGHEVSIFDLNVEIFHQVHAAKKKRWIIPDVNTLIELAKRIAFEDRVLFDRYVQEVLNTEAEVIGFSVYDTNLFFSLTMAREIKRKYKNRIVVFGGPECFPLWSGRYIIQETVVDAVVYGEGEETMLDIIRSIEKSGKIEPCLGTITKEGSRLIDCGAKPPVEDLDKLPLPDFSDFPLDKYLTTELPIVFNRGCPRRCTYCSTPSLIPRYRWRSAYHIYEEIKYQLQKYPHIDSFHSHGPSLSSNLEELSRLCDLIIRDELRFKWSGFASINSAMNIDLLRKMRMAGCFGLNIGIESGSQRIIDRMQKNFRIEEAECILRDAHSTGLETVVNFIIGFPGETEDDFQETLRFILRNWEYITYIGSMNTCWIEPYIYLFDHPEEFDIVIGSNPHEWQSIDGKNTLQIRKERKKRFEDFISSLGRKISRPEFIEA
jgi:anaerobic magnesium-protoporphyrin IX monomethyl ester cyclase